MSRLAQNAATLSISGQSMNTWAIEFAPDLSAAEIDITAGFSTDWTSTASGLKTFKGKMTIVYETADVATYLPLLQPGATRSVIYGPEGSTAGKPKHHQDCVFSKISGPKVNVDKSLTIFEVDITGTGTPTTNIYAGGVW